MTSIHRWQRVSILIVLGVLLLGADSDPTRIVTLRWQHDGDISGFRVYRHTYLKPWDRGVDVGRPKQIDEIYLLEIELSNLEATWIAIASYNSQGVESEKSNSRVYLLPESESVE